MSRKRYGILLVLIMTATIVGAAMASRFFAAQPVQAEQTGEVRRTGAQKWEYCAVIGTPTDQGVKFGNYTSVVRILYFQSAEYPKQELVEGQIGTRDYPKSAGDDAMSKAIAKLGDEGWEMVGRGQFRIKQEPDALYFKRPKP